MGAEAEAGAPEVAEGGGQARATGEGVGQAVRTATAAAGVAATARQQATAKILSARGHEVVGPPALSLAGGLCPLPYAGCVNDTITPCVVFFCLWSSAGRA